MVVLLHKLEAEDNVRLLHTFTKFATVQTYKYPIEHSKTSSFYMVATDIQPAHPACVSAMSRWTELWKVATFGTEEDYDMAINANYSDINTLLKEFGAELMELGERPWSVQAHGLESAPYNQIRDHYKVSNVHEQSLQSNKAAWGKD